MTAESDRLRRYQETLDGLDEASRQHSATRSETQDRQVDRAAAIVEVSKMGVPRGVVATLSGLTRGRVQQILEAAGESGATGDDWGDPDLRQMVEAAIAGRPVPSVGVGVRRESTFGPHLGRGVGGSVRLTGDLDKDRATVVARIEALLRQVKLGKHDDMLTLTDGEFDLVKVEPSDD